jgi:S-adenosylmethionine synthetase
MQNTNELTKKICNRISDYILDGSLTNDQVVQIIEHAGQYLNLKTIADYAEKNKLSYNGVKKHRQIITLFGCKLVIDNE